MIVIKVELWSAVTKQRTELARMHICNEGVSTNGRIRDYSVQVLRGRSTVDLDKGTVLREGKVLKHPALALHVWHLVAKALVGMGYGSK